MDELVCVSCGLEATEANINSFVSGFSEAWGRHVTCCGELCFKLIWPS